MKTITATPSTIRRKWYLIDGKDQTLGRLASEVAKRLSGKHKPEYTPNLDTGDFIVVINAADIHVTGKKKTDKIYHRNSGYTSGLRSLPYEKLLAIAPIKPLEIAVKGMLPKGPLGRKMFRKLNVYGGSAHPHAAQQPELLSLAE